MANIDSAFTHWTGFDGDLYGRPGDFSAAQQLRAALGDVRRQEREAQLTQGRRDDAIALWNRHYQGVADTITGIYELVGRPELADRVRPTARRRAGLTEDTDAPATPATPATPAVATTAPAAPATPAAPAAAPAAPAAPAAAATPAAPAEPAAPKS